jgi:hypothetical protein
MSSIFTRMCGHDTGGASRGRFVFFLGCLILAGSFTFHAFHAGEHFQECDSSFSYHAIFQFPRLVLNRASNEGASGNIISESTAQAILSLPIVSHLIHEAAPGVSVQQLIDRLTRTSPLYLFRLAIYTPLFSLHLPFFLRASLAFFTTPYAIGPGFLYGLVSGGNMFYETFMLRSTLLTQFVFHGSVLLLYLTALRMGIRKPVAILGSLTLLFSISMYSYGYHLGSTVWNYGTGFLWVWFLVRYWGDARLFRIISWVTATLLFFNYLIALYWLAFITVVFGRKYFLEKPPLTILLRQIYSSQRATLWCAASIFLLLYPPGQGNRGTTSSATFLSDFYYVVLNFVSIYNHSPGWDAAQFIIAVILLACGAFWFVRRGDGGATVIRGTLLVVTGTLIIFILFVALGILGFAPSRHILFLAPAFFLFFLAGFDYISIFIPEAVIWLLVFVFLGGGALLLGIRADDVIPRYEQVSIDPGIEKVIVHDCNVHLGYRDWDVSRPPEIIPNDPKFFKENQEYLFLSQNEDIRTVIRDQWSMKDGGYDINANILSEESIINPTYFLAYNPRNFRHTPWNSIFKARVIFHQIKKL